MNNFAKAFLCILVITLVTSLSLPLYPVKAQETLFKVTIIAPGNANLVRRQWGQIFANSLNLLGIDASVVLLGWTSVYDRVMTPPPSIVGKTWAQGGYDMELMGWTPGLIPEPRQVYYGGAGFFAPLGQNYYLWNDTDGNLLLDQFITSTNSTYQDEVLQKWQSLYFNEMPSSQIMYQSAPAIVNPALSNFGTSPNGEGWLYFNVQPSPEWLKKGTETDFNATYCSTSEIQSLIPPLSNSWYDTIIFNNIYGGLAMDSSDTSNLHVPSLLTSWSSTNNGFNWTYNLRHDVRWHDWNATNGFTFSADDVLFSIWACMNGGTGSQFVGYYQSVYGNKVTFKWENGTSTVLGNGSRVGSITALDPYTVQAKLPVLALGKPYGYIDPYLLTLSNNIIPKHIFEKIPVSEWSLSCFNTGQGEKILYGTKYTGPVGTGPYKWVSFDPVAQLVHLTRNDDYWNATALKSEGMFGMKDYYIRYIADKTGAIAALKNREVDMLDANYQMQVDIPSIDPTWGKVFVHEGTGRQEIGYNMQHPIFGTGTDTPLGKSNASRAAEAARYVRQAFDYAIPRELVITNLLSGFGQPGATPMLPTQPFYNSSVTARAYDLSKARDLLELAGYTVPELPKPATPSFILGMSTALSGTFTDPSGNVLANRLIDLRVTTDNATYNSTTTLVAETTTNLNGFYSFTVTPTSTGTFYYYLFDYQANAGEEWKYLTSVNVSTLQDQLLPLMYIGVGALIIAVVLGGIAIYLALRKPKQQAME